MHYRPGDYAIQMKWRRETLTQQQWAFLRGAGSVLSILAIFGALHEHMIFRVAGLAMIFAIGRAELKARKSI